MCVFPNTRVEIIKRDVEEKLEEIAKLTKSYIIYEHTVRLIIPYVTVL